MRKKWQKIKEDGPCFCDPIQTKHSPPSMILNIEYASHIVLLVISNQNVHYVMKQRFLLIIIKKNKT